MYHLLHRQSLIQLYYNMTIIRKNSHLIMILSVFWIIWKMGTNGKILSLRLVTPQYDRPSMEKGQFSVQVIMKLTRGCMHKGFRVQWCFEEPTPHVNHNILTVTVSCCLYQWLSWACAGHLCEAVTFWVGYGWIVTEVFCRKTSYVQGDSVDDREVKRQPIWQQVALEKTTGIFTKSK